MARSPNHICATFDPSTKTMTVHVATGCKSSSLRYLGHDLKVTAITGTPVLELSGAFKYRRPKGKRYKRDCAARKKADIELHNVEPRRYIVVANGDKSAADFRAGDIFGSPHQKDRQGKKQ